MIICAYYGRIIMIMIGCECFSDICLEYSGPGNRISGPEVRKPVLKCESISTALSISGHTPPYPRTHIFLSRDPSLYLRTHPCMSGPVPKVLELGAYLKTLIRDGSVYRAVLAYLRGVVQKITYLYCKLILVLISVQITSKGNHMSIVVVLHICN